MCCDDADNCCGKFGAVTGVGGGKNAFDGTLACAPLGGGANDVKLIPPVVVGAVVGNRGAGGIVHVDKAVAAAAAAAGVTGPPPNRVLSLQANIVCVRDASNAATASGDKVCEKLNGGNGTDPGAAPPAAAAPAATAAADKYGLNLDGATPNLFAAASTASVHAVEVDGSPELPILMGGVAPPLLVLPLTAEDDRVAACCAAARAAADVAAAAAAAAAAAEYGCDTAQHNSATFVSANNASTCTAGRSCKFNHDNKTGIQFCV